MMRINRYLALCGFGSRRAVEDLIVGGAVKVGGEIVYDLARQIELRIVITPLYSTRARMI